ncbi:hypothetical protein JW756_06365 [Candidatus Woesearchaeota archaeon]|nr:hypothetical protein [Candidatus Woesearchaeota archaeon]
MLNVLSALGIITLFIYAGMEADSNFIIQRKKFFITNIILHLLIVCGVGYGSNLEKVERVTIDVARKIQKTIPGAVKSFEPFIRYNAFWDSNIDFTVILRVEKFLTSTSLFTSSLRR